MPVGDMHRPTRLGGWIGEISGSVADFGTFLPLVLGVLAIDDFDATGVLVGFGVFALAVAVYYRRPIPVQPMKVVTALIIVGALTPPQAMASGLIIGGILIALSFAGVIGRLARLVPETVTAGIQLGVGVQLAILGIRHVADQPIFGLGALAVLAALHFTAYRNLSSILVFAVAAAVSLSVTPGQFAGIQPGLHLPTMDWPTGADFEVALIATTLPQLALTLSNAVLATAVIAGDYFPEDRDRITPARLAAGTGILNVCLVPFGAVPMCHGSGGLVAQYGFGARHWAAPAIFGTMCLVLGLGFGADAATILAVVPLGAVGAMLAVAGTEMAFGRHIRDAAVDSRVVIVLTGVACVVTNIAAGLLIGLALEGLRAVWIRRSGASRR